MIRAIIFDCFGVLAEDGWTPFKRKYIGDNQELADQLVDLGKQNEFGIITNDEYYETAASMIGVEEKLLTDAVGMRVPNEELFEFIRTELKPKYKIGLLSNANYDVVNELFEPEQATLFDASVLSYESRLIKPDPRMYRQMAERLGVSPEDCIFIDDQARYVEAAEVIGMKGLTYSTPTVLKRDLLQLL